jgi:nicotinamidase/pyrazinamidase
MSDNPYPREGDALIIVDVQNDFLPGGALAVPEGDVVASAMNDYIDIFTKQGLSIYATRDWHTPDHSSFQAQGGPWPVHCVAGSEGARFAPALHLPAQVTVISKGTRRNQDGYSGFEATDLAERLRASGIGRLFIGGLATDYCVLNTVRGALAGGFRVFLLEDAIRAVDVNPGDGDKAVREMRQRGAITVNLNEVWE